MTRLRVVVVTALIGLAVSALPPGAVAHDASCGGIAPITISCTTGTHVASSGAPGVVVNGGLEYAGTVESRLTWSGGVRIFRCDFVPAVTLGCSGTGPFPPPGSPFVHDCFSRTLFLSFGFGSGSWSCQVTHL